MQQEFDVKKWRLEHPMDYFKALELMCAASNKDEIFKQIYKVTRLHLPETLYKYYSLSDSSKLNEAKFKTLKSQHIFMSDIKDFNDPFDSRAFFYNQSDLLQFERLRPHGGKLIDDFAAYLKSSAFTDAGINCMPMWAHYANGHRGFCVSYDIKPEENSDLCSQIFPVQYANTRIDVTTLMVEQARKIIEKTENSLLLDIKPIIISDLSLIYMSLLLSNIKHSTWSYEKEYRCTTASNAKGMPYLPAKPSGIYIGLKCSGKHVSRLIEISRVIKIPVYKMEFNECETYFDLSASRLE